MAQETQTAVIPSGLPADPVKPNGRWAPIERHTGSSASEIHARLRPHEFERRPDTVEGKEFTFNDLVDILNPLHHLPLISGLYRSLTGDEISPHARVMGGFLYGGASGLMRSGLEAAVLQETGQELTAQAMAAMNGQVGTAYAAYGKPATRVMIAGNDDPGMDLAAEAAQLAQEPSDSQQQAELDAEPDRFASGPDKFVAAGLRRLPAVYSPPHSVPAFLHGGQQEVIHDGPSGRPLGLLSTETGQAARPAETPLNRQFALAGSADGTGPRGLPANPRSTAAERPALAALRADDGLAAPPKQPAFLRRGERIDDGPSGIPLGLVRRGKPLAPPTYGELATGAARHAQARQLESRPWLAPLRTSAGAFTDPGPGSTDPEPAARARQPELHAAIARYQTAQALFDARDQHR